jgi:hypothetical protein
VQYAQETQHEKILRGLAVGIALTMYGRLEEADTLIDTLIGDKDPILRRSGMYTIAMAYCGTGHNEAIRKLLHVAVSDVNDDVRRAAVTGLGFLLFRSVHIFSIYFLHYKESVVIYMWEFMISNKCRQNYLQQCNVDCHY